MVQDFYNSPQKQGAIGKGKAKIIGKGKDNDILDGIELGYIPSGRLEPLSLKERLLGHLGNYKKSVESGFKAPKEGTDLKKKLLGEFPISEEYTDKIKETPFRGYEQDEWVRRKADKRTNAHYLPRDNDIEGGKESTKSGTSLHEYLHSTTEKEGRSIEKGTDFLKAIDKYVDDDIKNSLKYRLASGYGRNFGNLREEMMPGPRKAKLDNPSFEDRSNDYLTYTEARSFLPEYYIKKYGTIKAMPEEIRSFYPELDFNAPNMSKEVDIDEKKDYITNLNLKGKINEARSEVKNTLMDIINKLIN